MQTCLGFREFMTTQRIALKRALQKDKWYESEKAGRDVGERFAEMHFLDVFAMRWARRFRRHYCNRLCEHRHDCHKRESRA